MKKKNPLTPQMIRVLEELEEPGRVLVTGGVFTWIGRAKKGERIDYIHRIYGATFEALKNRGALRYVATRGALRYVATRGASSSNTGPTRTIHEINDRGRELRKEAKEG